MLGSDCFQQKCITMYTPDGHYDNFSCFSLTETSDRQKAVAAMDRSAASGNIPCQAHYLRVEPDDGGEIFTFEPPNIQYCKVTDERYRPAIDDLSDRMYRNTEKCCSDVMVIVGLPFVCLTAIILQIFRFAMVDVFRPLLTGLVIGISDGLMKPVASAAFNGLVQPLVTIFYNLGVNFKLVLTPMAEIVTLFAQPVGSLLKSFRLVEVRYAHSGIKNKSLETI